MTKSTAPQNIVVYADDDPDDLELVSESFRRYAQNVELVNFTDGISALKYLDSLTPVDQLPCLIILDINMPLLNGKDVLVALRKIPLLKNIPVVLFTTSSQPLDKLFAEKYHSGFITKPLDLRQMERITDEFISNCTENIRNNIRRKVN